MELLKERSFQVASLLLLLLVWQVTAVLMDTTALPPPTEVAGRVWDLVVRGRAWTPLRSTLLSTVLGFTVGYVVGLAYGIAAYVFPRTNDAALSLFNVVLFTPTLIIIFLGLVMLGHDNRLTVVLIVAFVVFPNVAIYIRDALSGLDDEILVLADSYNVATKQRVVDMYIPHLVPPLLSSGRIAFSMAWKVTFLTEVFGFPEGLGWQVRSAYFVYDMRLLLAWLSIFVFAILMIEQVIRRIERSVVKW